jgi:Flp pilus assembly protein TadG
MTTTTARPPQTSPRRPARGDRGSESVELAILLPVGIVVLALIVIGARIALASDRISGVAGIAARDASIARSASSAQRIATSSATAALASDNLHCTNIRVTVDTSGFDAPPGTSAAITVDVWCTVDLSDISVQGMPGSRTLHDVATSPLDPARDLSLGLADSGSHALTGSVV